MKKIIALILVVLVLFASLSAFAEIDDPVDFEATITDGLDVTIDEWFTDADTRALCALLLIYDYENSTGTELSLDFTKDWYVGNIGEILCFHIALENDGDLILYYAPNAISQYTLYTYSENVITSSFSQNSYKYYEITASDIADVAQQLAETGEE